MDNIYGNTALISMISSLKNQVNVMENFLSWLCPDYTRIKHLWEYQSHSVSSQPLQNNTDSSSNIPLETLLASLPPNVLQELKNKINKTNAKIAPASSKVRKRRCVPVPNEPTPTKQRGRKRKLHQNPHVPAHQNIEPVVLKPVPVNPPLLYFKSQRNSRSDSDANDVCLPINALTSSNVQKKQHLVDNKSSQSYTSLDMLAAVSSAFRTQESSNVFIPTTAKVSNNPPSDDHFQRLPAVSQPNINTDANAGSESEVYFTSTENCDLLTMENPFGDSVRSSSATSKIPESSHCGSSVTDTEPNSIMGLDSYSPSLSPIYTSLEGELNEEYHIFTSVPAQEIIV